MLQLCLGGDIWAVVSPSCDFLGVGGLPSEQGALMTVPVSVVALPAGKATPPRGKRTISYHTLLLKSLAEDLVFLGDPPPAPENLY
jgi:hypothetical protein